MKSLTRASFIAVAALAFAAGACKKEEPAKPGQPAAAPGAGDKIASGAKEVGQGIAEGAKAAWDKTKEGAAYVGDKVAEGAKYVGDRVATGAKLVAAEAADGWITTKIKGKIGLSRLFSVSVDTAQGVVTLTGKVKSEAEKTEIEGLARSTDNVKQVISKLVVEAAAPVVNAPPAPAPAPAK